LTADYDCFGIVGQQLCVELLVVLARVAAGSICVSKGVVLGQKKVFAVFLCAVQHESFWYSHDALLSIRAMIEFCIFRIVVVCAVVEVEYMSDEAPIVGDVL
jgi:hypothetical protein